MMAERYDSFTDGAPRRPFVLPRIAVSGLRAAPPWPEGRGLAGGAGTGAQAGMTSTFPTGPASQASWAATMSDSG